MAVRALLFLLMCPFFLKAQSIEPQLVIPTGNTGRIDVLRFNHVADQLISADASEELILWDVLTGKIHSKLRADSRVTEVQFSGDDQYVYASTVSGKLFRWKVKGFAERIEIPVQDKGIVSFEIYDGGIFTIGSDSTIRVLDPYSYDIIKTITDYEVSFTEMTADPVDHLIAMGDQGGNLILLNSQNLQEEYFGPVFDAGVRSLRFSLNGEFLFALDNAGNLYTCTVSPLKVISKQKVFKNTGYAMEVYGNIAVLAGRDPRANFKTVLLNEASEQRLDLDFKENYSQPNFIYGINALSISPTSFLAIPDYNGSIRIFDLNKQVGVNRLRGYASPVKFLNLDDQLNLLYSNGRFIKSKDLSGTREQKIIEPNVETAQMDVKTNRFVLLGQDSILRVFEREKLIKAYTVTGDAFLAPVLLSPDGSRVLFRKSDAKISVWDIASGSISDIKAKNCYRMRAHYGGITAYVDGKYLETFSWNGLKRVQRIEQKGVRDFDLDEEGKQWVGLVNKGNRSVIVGMNLEASEEVSELVIPEGVGADKIVKSFSPDVVYTYVRSVGKLNQKEDYSIRKWNLKTREEEAILEGHEDFINDLTESRNGMVFSGSDDGTIQVWNPHNEQHLSTIIPLGKKDWVVMNREGLFDASSGAFRKMHYALNNQIVPLIQLKNSFYEPKLLQKQLSLTKEELFNASLNKVFTLFPSIEVLSVKNGKIHLRFTDQGGGVGEINFKLNNKEILHDIRSDPDYDNEKQEFIFDYSIHPFIKKGALNKITIEAFNSSGYRISNHKQFYFVEEESASGNKEPSKLYVVSIGISDYRGKAIDLNFAATDANDFSDVMEAGGPGFYGAENFEMYRLTTQTKDQQLWPYKKNIERVFKEIALKVNPKDAVVIYFAGHGLDLEGDSEFYFLTGEAELPYIRPGDKMENFTISTSELGDAMNRIASDKQLLILDACHSGKLLTGLFDSEGALKTESIRALDDLKDKAGIYVLASSESEEVSFESNHLEGGLLTYSMLFGLKGSALSDNQFIDVVDVMQYAKSKVPELAGDIGEKQVPIIKIPDDASSFLIGRLTTEQRNAIELHPPKPIILGTNFQNETTLHDEYHIAVMVDDELRRVRSERNNTFLVIRDKAVFNEAYSLYGRYSLKEGEFTIRYTLFKGEEPVLEDRTQTRDLQAFTRDIVMQILEHVLEQ